MIRHRQSQPRSAASLVEFAFISAVALVFLFGILEYARYVFLLQVTHNAVREGARYAVVRTGDATTKQNVIDEVTRRMAGRDKEVSGYQVEVDNVDPDTGVKIPNTNWNDSAFGNAISVKVTGTYNPILPSLLMMAGSLPVRATSMMSSEAN